MRPLVLAPLNTSRRGRAVPRLDDERQRLPILGHAARPNRDDLTLLGILLGAVREDDAVELLVLLLETLDQDPVMGADAA